MIKEPFHCIDKVWGEEIWLVNNDKYCGKLLLVDKDAEASYHYHKTKQETFYCLEGYGVLTVEGKDYTIAPTTRPKTIMPNEKHKFRGITEMILLEISTTHSEEDVVRLEPSGVRRFCSRCHQEIIDKCYLVSGNDIFCKRECFDA